MLSLEPPADFVRRLREEFDDRLRIRWSLRNQEWQIEQKVGRAALPPIRISEIDDSRIRARDGYAYVLAVQPGTTMACRVCHMPVRVEAFHFREVTCEYCARVKRRDVRYGTAYFPLGETLLDHLKKTDPYRDGTRRQQAEADAHNERLVASRDRAISTLIRDALHEGVLAQLPQWGYTKTAFWDRA